jgi:hypothetical protein
MRTFVLHNFVPAALALIFFMVSLPFFNSVVDLYSEDQKFTVTLHCDDNITSPPVNLKLEQK